MKKVLLKRFLSFSLFVLFTVLGFAGCGLQEGEQTKKSVLLDETVKELLVGETFTLTATTEPADLELTWSSSNESVATVSNGTVTAIAAGTATVTAKNGDAQATCAITVKALERKYSVKFVNGEDELKVVEVEEGAFAVYNGIIPQKAADESTFYEFAGWSETEGGETVDLSDIEITANKTFYAVFSERAYVTLAAYNGEELSVLPAEMKEYLQLTDESAIAEYLYNYEENYRRALSADGVVFNWDVVGDEAVTFYLSTDVDFEENLFAESVSGETLKIYNLVPGTYYWKVVTESGRTGGTDYFTLTDSVRAINCGNIANMRDEGGYVGEFGTVAYGKVYRSADIADANEAAIAVLVNQLGIKTEIDLRIDTTTVSPDESINKVDCGILQNDYIFPGFNSAKGFKQAYADALKQAFKLFADEANYPIVFHCTSGADRTGTFAFLLGGLLGEDYSDLVKDFELTSFYMHRRWRSAINVTESGYEFDESGVMQDDSGNLVAFDKMYRHMMSAYGNGDGKLSSAVENYLISVVGLTKYEIETIRYILLGSEIKPDADRTYTITWNIDGKVKEQSFIYGSTPIWYGSAPVREEAETWSYKFSGWALSADGEKIGALPKVTENATYYAIFEIDEIFEAPKFKGGNITYSSLSEEIFMPDGLLGEGVTLSQIKLKSLADAILFDGENWEYSLIALTDSQLIGSEVVTHKTVVELSDGTKYRVDLVVYAGIIDELSDFVKFFDKAPETSYRNEDHPEGMLAAQNFYGYYIITSDLGDGTDELSFDNQTTDTDYIKPNGFNGVLDGRGHTLRFKLTKGGLLGLILGNAVIKNTGFIFEDLTPTKYGLFGYMAVGAPEIRNCYIEQANNNYGGINTYGIMAQPLGRLVLHNTVVYGYNFSNQKANYWGEGKTPIAATSTNAYVIHARPAASGYVMSTNFTKVFNDGVDGAREVLLSEIADASGFNSYWSRDNSRLSWKGAETTVSYKVI